MKPFKIERGIAVPPRSNAARFPLKSLNPGESFAVARSEAGVEGLTLYTAIQNFQQRKRGRKFTVRAIDKKTFRVWRTK